jgi:hypothetical protein
MSTLKFVRIRRRPKKLLTELLTSLPTIIEKWVSRTTNSDACKKIQLRANAVKSAKSYSFRAFTSASM